MQERPVAEVKRDFRRVLDAAERGESTVVLRHGRPVAAIAPVLASEALGAPLRPVHQGLARQEVGAAGPLVDAAG